LKRPKLRDVAREVAESMPWDATVRNMLMLHDAIEVQPDLPPLILNRKLRVA